MHILLAVDDTDNKETRGTGWLAAEIAEAIEQRGRGNCSRITRHQLYVHPDIPYTSHNSTMCFGAELESGFLAEVIQFAGEFLAARSAAGSDPGLCVVQTAALDSPELLIAFGRMAKKGVLTKDDAYNLAQKLGIHLTEHGGTGQGVIGALAGTGLRLSGNDGRFRGKFSVATPGEPVSVGELRSDPRIESVQSLDGDIMADHILIYPGEKLKTVLLGGRSVLLVRKAEALSGEIHWQTCTKEELKRF